MEGEDLGVAELRDQDQEVRRCRVQVPDLDEQKKQKRKRKSVNKHILSLKIVKRFVGMCQSCF